MELHLYIEYELPEMYPDQMKYNYRFEDSKAVANIGVYVMVCVRTTLYLSIKPTVKSKLK